MTNTWLCEKCLTVVRSVYDRVERRTELRRKSDDGRMAVFIDERWCKTCAEEYIESRRPVGANQPGLFA